MKVPVAAVMISRRPRTISGDYYRAHEAMTGSKRPRVVIAGAGFGGLRAVRALARSPASVLLIDRNNYHTFNPMLYQVAAADRAPEARAYALSPAAVLLIDRNNYHTFNPMLYQVAAAELEPEQIAYPVRSILRK